MTKPIASIEFTLNDQPWPHAGEILYQEFDPRGGQASVTSTRPATGRAAILLPLHGRLSPKQLEVAAAMRWRLICSNPDLERDRERVVIEGPGLPQWEPGCWATEFRSFGQLLDSLVEPS